MEHLKFPGSCLLVFYIKKLEGELNNKVARVVVIQVMHQKKRVVKDFFRPSRHLFLSWIDKMMSNAVFPPSFPKFCLTRGNDHGMHHCAIHNSRVKVLILIIVYFNVFYANSTI